MRSIYNIATAMFFMAGSLFVSCIGSGDDTIVLESGNNSGIPGDNLATANPPIGTSSTSIPNIQYVLETDGSDAIMRIDMTGVQQAGSYDWLRLIGTAQNGQNIWLSIDGKPKGILVYNNADNNNDQQLVADLVFIVDNSGSMSEEADAIARDIVEWANKLAASSLDIQFGCVGYSVSGEINGAINLTNSTSLADYLNRSSGTSRTMGFSGPDESLLRRQALGYSLTEECGGMALRYADANMNFRQGSNRIYVNFTDEPNQPNGKYIYSVEYFADQNKWTTKQGTVHTVYSDSDTTFTERPSYKEKPWRISKYTGGTTLVVPSDFAGVTLESLPVTGAMTNSYTIRFTNISEFMDGKAHEVKITILSKDGMTRAERIFYIVFSGLGN